MLLLVDPAKHAVEAAYQEPGKGGHFIVLTPDESKIYLSNKEGPMGVFDVKARTFKAGPSFAAQGVTRGNGSGTEGLAVSPDGKRIAIFDNDKSYMHIIDTATDKVVASAPLIHMPLQSQTRSRLVRVRYSPDGKTIVATTLAGGEAWIIDAADIRKQMITPVAKGPQGMAFDPDGRSVVVSSHDSGLLTRIDLKTGKAIGIADGGEGIEVLSYY
jgi:DNA-binding beta-propeller fold protein YncE